MTDSCLGTQRGWLRFKGFCFSGSFPLAVMELGSSPQGITASLPSRLLTFTHRLARAAFSIPQVSGTTGSFQVWVPRHSLRPEGGGGSSSLPVYPDTSQHPPIVSQAPISLMWSVDEQRVLSPGSAFSHSTWVDCSAPLNLSFHLGEREPRSQLPGWCRS